VKKSLIALAIIILAAYSGIFYLNHTVFPVKLKAAIVKGLEDATGKKALIGSVRFSIFKGLVLEDLIIRDDMNAIVNVRKAYCRFFIIPLFKKEVIISRLLLESPDIFVERRADNSFNIIELFPKERIQKSDFKAFIHRISIKKGIVTFHDLTLDPLYAREIKDLDADVRLSLPAKLKFNAGFTIIPAGSPAPVRIGISGEYLPSAKELAVEIRTTDFLPKEFARYYEKTGISFPEGRFDSTVNLKYKDSDIIFDTEAGTASLTLAMDKLIVKMKGTGRSKIRYSFADKRFYFTGSADIKDMSINGIEYIDAISNIKGRLQFSDRSLSSDNITAITLGIPVEAKVTMDSFDKPVLNIESRSDIRLEPFQEMLDDRFGLNVPAEFSGEAKLRLEIQYPLIAQEELRVKGLLYMLSASVRFGAGKDRLENVTGNFQFLPNQASWEDIGFRFRDIHYKSSGTLTNFKTPGIRIKLASNDLSLDAALAVNGKVMNFSKFSGKYLNSEFSGRGTIDASGAEKLKADMEGLLVVDLEDLKRPLKKFKDKFERVKPKGIVRAEVILKGDLKDLKSCVVDANLSSDNLSFYGLKLATSTMNYSQRAGAGDILFMRSFFYGGSMASTGRIEWDEKDVPYRLDMDIDGVRIEKFKADTAFKDKDIAGSIKMHAKLRGVLKDTARLSGGGRIAVTEGNLWQLNLFKGLGVLLFTSDFSKIIFKEGHCDFTIADRYIYTDEITLKSDLLDLYGPIKIGFDRSITGTVKAEFLDEAIGSTVKRSLSTVFGRYSLINITGTLKEPQYKIKPDVETIVESIAEQFTGE